MTKSLRAAWGTQFQIILRYNVKRLPQNRHKVGKSKKYCLYVTIQKIRFLLNAWYHALHLCTLNSWRFSLCVVGVVDTDSLPSFEHKVLLHGERLFISKSLQVFVLRISSIQCLTIVCACCVRGGTPFRKPMKKPLKYKLSSFLFFFFQVSHSWQNNLIKSLGL